MEETLKEIMGEAYKENMSKDDIQAFFKKQVVSGGDYVNSGKANAEKKELNDKIAALQAELDAKLTDEEKSKKEDADFKKEFEKLKKALAESKAAQSQMSAKSILAETKIKAGIKDEDTEYDEFISEISFEDSDKTSKVTKYISKIVAAAYDCGKNDAIKNKLGKMGDFKGSSDGDSSEEKGSFGKQLAQASKFENKNAKNFFERK